MKPAPVPADDEVRVADLRAARLLDTPREERFDRITDLAADVFGTAMAFVTLVDAERQWFKSACGITGVDETPRGPGFCAHAIFEPEVLVVEDATRDERFADNPFVTGAFGLRFYAGVPVKGPGGQPIGTLCLVDTRPHDFGADDVRRLRKMAALVQAEILRT
jgi:GAF domain-containing protein